VGTGPRGGGRRGGGFGAASRAATVGSGPAWGVYAGGAAKEACPKCGSVATVDKEPFFNGAASERLPAGPCWPAMESPGCIRVIA